MKLISSPTSPFVRKCRVLIMETGLAESIEEHPVATTPFNSAPEAVAANPLGKIPALIRDDAPAIYDSRVITRFLDMHAKAGLYPESRLWEVLTLEATADAIMEAAVSMTYEVRLRPEDRQSTDWIEAQWQKVARALDAVEERWMSHLNGPMDITHIGMGCALGYIDFRHGDRGWREGRDQLAAWYAAFAERDSMQATIPA